MGKKERLQGEGKHRAPHTAAMLPPFSLGELVGALRVQLQRSWLTEFNRLLALTLCLYLVFGLYQMLPPTVIIL